MTGSKHDRLTTYIREKAAEFISLESNRTSLITVTNVSVAGNERRATIFVSVMPEKEEAQAIDFLRRKRPEMREFLRKEIRGGNIPFLEIEIDKGEKNRQLIEEISNSK